MAPNLPIQGRQQIVDVGGGFDSLSYCAFELLVGLLLEPLGPLASFRRQESFQIDADGSCYFALVLALAGESDGLARGDLHAETHHGLIDRADLLNIEGSITQTFTVQQKELAQD